jgi:hypothetical protein
MNILSKLKDYFTKKEVIDEDVQYLSKFYGIDPKEELTAAYNKMFTALTKRVVDLENKNNS